MTPTFPVATCFQFTRCENQNCGHVHLLLGDENEQPIAELLIPDNGIDKFIDALRKTASQTVEDVLREVAAGDRPRRH